jgi:hypothetical protein
MCVEGKPKNLMRPGGASPRWKGKVKSPTRKPDVRARYLF